jgi:ABC-type glutathione transport system ATPase component
MRCSRSSGFWAKRRSCRFAIDKTAWNDLYRGQTVSMIFQEPALALDPVYTIGRQIAETVMRHEGKSHADAMARALEMLEVVRIPSARRRLDAYAYVRLTDPCTRVERRRGEKARASLSKSSHGKGRPNK